MSGPEGTARYTPLRVHGEHSLLTGVDAPGVLHARAAELGFDALALTDSNSLAGLVDHLRAAESSGLRPIVGAELDDPSGAPGRVVALVRTKRGYRNLCKLVSARRLGADPGEAGDALPGPEAFDLADAAARYAEGLTLLVDHPRLAYALAGRVSAEHLALAVSPASVAKHSRVRVRRAGPGVPRNAARDAVGKRALRRPPSELAGGESEATDEPKPPPPARSVPARDLVETARALGLATLAVPDVHHALPAGRPHHRVRAGVLRNALLCDLPDGWVAEAPSHLLEAAALARVFDGLPDAPGPWRGADALERTRRVADACRYAPPLDEVWFPDVELPPDQTAYSALVDLAFTGARERFRPLRPEVVRRLDAELSAIDALGYAAYFLLVRRIADFAKGAGIPCVGRGSAADSLVAYCLRLTDADPLRYRLPFERFLNPQREDRPDIDLDFCWRRRDEVLERVYAEFGPERTAMICTLNTFGLRAAFREVALVEGVPPVEVKRWSRYLPHSAPHPSDRQALERGHRPPDELADCLLARAVAATPECRGFPFGDPRWRRVLQGASALLDVPRHFGLHPGGVVVSPGPITDFVACQRSAKGPVVTQLDKDAVEAIGLVKMDLLGNRALTVIDDCLGSLRERGVEVDWEALPEDEPRTARTLERGRTLGCFQIESPGMRNLLQQVRARDMDAVIQTVALIRPGPAGSGMKDAFVRRARGLEPPLPPHPRLADLLWETHGVLLYQEDVMQAAVALAGLDLAEADELRRQLKKRRTDDREALRDRFLEGCEGNGVEPGPALACWEQLANFVSFSFCKAHAVTYGQLAWRTAWLKTHHPAPFLAAFLASHTGYYEPRVYVEEARRLGVPILGPDVNKSADDFALEALAHETASPADAPPVDALRIGLAQVKGLSGATRGRVLAERARGGAFVSLPDLLERARPAVDEAEALIRAGALDALDRTRPELLWRLHLLTRPARRPPRDLEAGPDGPLDRGALAALRSTPAARAREAGTGGWGQRGLGLGGLDLAPGATAELFAPPPTTAAALPGLPDTSPRERALEELELLGLTVALHPVRVFERDDLDEATRRAIVPCADVPRLAGKRVAVLGWLAASRRVRTSDGRWMRFLTFEDESGLAEVVLFADAYERCGHRLVERGPFVAKGTVEDSNGACTLHAEQLL